MTKWKQREGTGILYTSGPLWCISQPSGHHLGPPRELQGTGRDRNVGEKQEESDTGMAAVWRRRYDTDHGHAKARTAER